MEVFWKKKSPTDEAKNKKQNKSKQTKKLHLGLPKEKNSTQPPNFGGEIVIFWIKKNHPPVRVKKTNIIHLRSKKKKKPTPT